MVSCCTLNKHVLNSIMLDTKCVLNGITLDIKQCVLNGITLDIKQCVQNGIMLDTKQYVLNGITLDTKQCTERYHVGH